VGHRSFDHLHCKIWEHATSCTREKGAGWDLPIPTANDCVPHGILAEEVRPMSHPWLKKVPGGHPGMVGPEVQFNL